LNNGFSTILGWISSFFSWFTSGVTYLVNILTSVFQLFAATLQTIIDVFVIFVNQWVSMIGFASNLFTGVYTSGVNVVTDYNLWGWMQLLAVCYIIWLYYLLIRDGLESVARHFEFMFNAFTFLFSLFLGVSQFFFRLIVTIIESIPIVE